MDSDRIPSSDRQPLPELSTETDLAVWFDPVCPFCWMTSKWVASVQRQRGLVVEWRLISLRLLNADIDYDAHFPPEYAAGHTAGLRLLRVAAAVRAGHGWQALETLHHCLGTHIFEVDPPADTQEDAGGGQRTGGRAMTLAVLADAGLDQELADALTDQSWDAVIQADTDLALSLAGKDVGTPILQFNPPDGPAFFGPIISRLPNDHDALRLWDHVTGLAAFAGFAELKRSLRELPQLRSLGVDDDEAGTVEDWHGGSRRHKDQRG